MHRLLALLLVLAAGTASAQPQEVLFPGLTGVELQAALVDAYKPAFVLSEAQAKDRMYDTLDKVTVDGEEGVIGVYTGFFVPFDCNPICDPSQDVYNNGAGLNMEHNWPRAEGAGSGNLQWDLHHLFPTKVNVNADRGNFPFAEIPDAQTTRWYRDDNSQTTIPDPGIIDEFSELRSGNAFEPREVHEGNVARALFYVATMYAGQVNLGFFTPQMETLYDWHYLDPVDPAEYERTQGIAGYQDDKANPFVLDSTLIRRAFFPEITTAAEPTLPAAPVRLAIAPNPFRETATLTLTLGRPGPVRVEVFDALGRRVALLHDGIQSAGRTRLSLDGTALPPGLYLVRVVTEAGSLTRRVVRGR